MCLYFFLISLTCVGQSNVIRGHVGGVEVCNIVWMLFVWYKVLKNVNVFGACDWFFLFSFTFFLATIWLCFQASLQHRCNMF